MKSRYCIGSKLPDAVFRGLVRAYFLGAKTEEAARALKISQVTVKNLYRRITYRLIDIHADFSFFYDLLRDCFETGGRRVDTLKKCLWACPGDKGYGDLIDRDTCTGCPFANDMREIISEDHAPLVIYFHRRALAPLNSFSFVNRAAYFYGQERMFYGPEARRRQTAKYFLIGLKKAPLGSGGSNEQTAHRYINKKGMLPLWYVASQGDEYHLPNHDMM